MTHKAALKKASKRASEHVQEMCSKMLDEMGEGPEYLCAVSSAATVILFHAVRVYMGGGKKDAASIIQAIVEDTAEHLKKADGIKLKIVVEEIQSKKDSKGENEESRKHL